MFAYAGVESRILCIQFLHWTLDKFVSEDKFSEDKFSEIKHLDKFDFVLYLPYLLLFLYFYRCK
ncbi:MAG TPA: hypothetical protein DCL61_28860 [Cyanobacteria bacterium UBA12227]|nr:hypothetical protein [Cyanobacteria bacterium UBA12227]